jgi:NAD(P)-dependent dehydrogenase (short-subunit alcohol dehydrogenase family)
LRQRQVQVGLKQGRGFATRTDTVWIYTEYYRYLSGVPMRRFGRPNEIAAAIAFLLSEDAGFITGQTLHVDGGASIGKAGF